MTASASQAAQGKVITLTALPNSGYVLKSLTVTTASGTSVPVANQSSGKYTFTMPAAAVTVKAVFAAQETDPDFPLPMWLRAAGTMRACATPTRTA